MGSAQQSDKSVKVGAHTVVAKSVFLARTSKPLLGYTQTHLETFIHGLSVSGQVQILAEQSFAQVKSSRFNRTWVENQALGVKLALNESFLLSDPISTTASYRTWRVRPKLELAKFNPQ